MIDNSDLIYDSALEDPSSAGDIIDTLQEGRDYILLPQEVWNQLHSWWVLMETDFKLYIYLSCVGYIPFHVPFYFSCKFTFGGVDTNKIKIDL